MSIQISLCPHPHWAMYFWDMMRVMLSPAGVAGMIAGEARNAVFSAPEIWVGVWASSRFLALTQSMCDETPAVYAASAVVGSPDRYAASALMNCNCEYVITG